MAIQQHINEARNANWRLSAQQKQINNSIADIEQRQVKKLSTFANLGSDLAMKGLLQLEQHRIKKNTSEAMYDWYRNKYKGYLGSDDSKKTADVLKASNVSSGIYHDNLKTAQEEGVPQHLIDKGAKRHPAYLATIAELETTRIANKFTPTIEHGMLTDETELFREDGSSFILNTATELDDKMLAHHYLSRKFLEDNNIDNDYGNGYLALPTDQGGSGFFAALDKAESGEGGLFSKYRVQSNIQISRERESVLSQAYIANPTGENFQKLVNAVKIGVTDKGTKRNYKQIWDYMDTFVQAGIDSGHIKFSDVGSIANQKVPGTDKTYAETWPTKFGYNEKKGVMGSMFRYAENAEETLSNARFKVKEIEFKPAVENLFERLLVDENQDGLFDLKPHQANKLYQEFRQEYGEEEWTVDGYKKLEEALEILKTDPLDVLGEVEGWKAWLDDPKKGGRLSDRKHELSPAVLRNPWIRQQLQKEQRLDEKDEYTDAIKTIENLPEKVIKDLVGKSSYDKDVDPGAVMEIQKSLKDYFNELLREDENMTISKAVSLTRDHYLDNGGDEDFADNKAAKDAGKSSNIYSLDSDGRLINNQIRKDLQPAPYTKAERHAVLKNKLKTFVSSGKGKVIDALSVMNTSTDGVETPAIQLEITPGQFETKESLNNIDLNKIPQYLNVVNEATGFPISQVINARRNLWGLPPLSKEELEQIGGDVSANLSNPIRIRTVGGNNDGLYSEQELKAQISQNSILSSFVGDNSSGSEFSEAMEILHSGAEKPDAWTVNTSNALFNATFGDKAIADMTTHGPFAFSEAANKNLPNIDFQNALIDDVDFNWNMYGNTGDTLWIPISDNLADFELIRKKKLSEKMMKLWAVPQGQNIDVIPSTTSDTA